MNNQPDHNPPDPETVVYSSKLIRKSSAVEDFMDKVRKVRWCLCHRGNDDHSNCEPYHRLEDALKLMVSYQLCLSDEVRVNKEAMTLGIYLSDRLFNCQCRVYERSDFGVEEDAVQGPDTCSDYVVARAKKLGVRDDGRSYVPPEVPKINWDMHAGRYCIKNAAGLWGHEGKEDASDYLNKCGVDRRSDGIGLSAVDEMLLNIRQNHAVTQMTELAGYEEGVHIIDGKPVLVPHGYKFIEPSETADPKTFPHVMAILRGLLVEPETQENQKSQEERWTPFWSFVTHIRASYNALKSGQRSGGLAVFMAGKIDAGKSLAIETIVGPLLGGRTAMAHSYLSGLTPFNDELFKRETWLLDDTDPPEDYATRKRFGSLLKQATAGNKVPAHGKGLPQWTVPIFRRIFCCLNLDDMETMPTFRESLEDKFMLLRAYTFVMPKGCLPLPTPPERPAFAEKILSEIPNFLAWLLSQNLSDFENRRFGAIAYKDPKLLEMLHEVDGLDYDMETLWHLLFDVRANERDSTENSSACFWTSLMSGRHADLASKTWKNKNALGKKLSALAKSDKYKKFVKVKTRDGINIYTIMRQTVEIKETEKSAY